MALRSRNQSLTKASGFGCVHVWQVYTVAILVIIYTVHVQQQRLSQGTVRRVHSFF